MCITIAANIAETGILTFPACFPDSVVGFITEPEKAEVKFVEYMFRFMRSRIQHEASGSVQDNINIETLERLRFPLPPLPEQRAIAHVLGTLDDLIELNRETNDILEEMARALFKSWFVDFDPVRAKLEGRPPAGMDAATAALFPDHFQDSELGQIPKGWTVGALSENIELLSGGTPKTSEPLYWNGDIPWYSVKDAPSETDVWVVDTEKKVTSLGITNSAAKILPERTTIISARGTVGKLALTGCPMAMNQSCYGVRGASGYGDFFTYYALKEAVEELQQNAHGSVFDTITRETFTSLRVASPSPSIVRAFDGVVEPLLETIQANVRESRDLATLRDTLLPKLLSGEISAPFAEELIAAKAE
jgi:type I restriction enzyme S subunit